MKLLHTADWHLGKVLKGVPRLDEQRAVMAELVAIADREAVDLVLVCGDVFESAAPTADALGLAWSTLLALRATGADVVVIGGNHDPAEHFDALAPVFSVAGVTLLGRPRAPQAGGVRRFPAARTGEPVRLALLPFVSQRGMVRAADLFHHDAAELAATYADKFRVLVDTLTAGFDLDAVNVVAVHAMVLGGKLGGGERDAQTIFDYGVSSTVFPPSTTYVAMGHLHRLQSLPGPAPVWYPGSPIAVDFGEQDDTKQVLLVEAAPGTPARVTPVPLSTPRALRTVHGTVAELAGLADSLGDALVRAVVTEPARAGLADEVRAVLPNVLEVRIDAPTTAPSTPRPSRSGRPPHQLFHDYLADQGVDDPRLEQLFAELLDAELAEGGC